MSAPVLIAGGGIGGLAAALACTRAGWPVQLFEQAGEFAEVGAGIQLGPNVTRRLHRWGLQAALAAVAAFPLALRVRSAGNGRLLATLPLGPSIEQRYGAPYATVHRADLHALLLQAVRNTPGAALHLNAVIQRYQDAAAGVRLYLGPGAPNTTVEGAGLVGADGLWSGVRTQLLGDGPPRLVGHLAYRALLPQQDLPAHLRSADVTLWLGPGLHAVQYPVRAGSAMNLVVIVPGRHHPELAGWNQPADAADLGAHLQAGCAALKDLTAAVAQWRMWVLCDRPPVQGAHEMARERVALLGDAAHPMRPYLAQGAGMAIEDAAQLEQCLVQSTPDIAAAFSRYAQQRWQRNARVQAQASRNSTIFHAQGPLRLARDLGLRLLGSRLLDQPWLYAHS